jgi:hypothetical protein
VNTAVAKVRQKHKEQREREQDEIIQAMIDDFISDFAPHDEDVRAKFRAELSVLLAASSAHASAKYLLKHQPTTVIPAKAGTQLEGE